MSTGPVVAAATKPSKPLAAFPATTATTATTITTTTSPTSARRTGLTHKLLFPDEPTDSENAASVAPRVVQQPVSTSADPLSSSSSPPSAPPTRSSFPPAQHNKLLNESTAKSTASTTSNTTVSVGTMSNVENAMRDLQERVNHAMQDQERRLQRIEHMVQSVLEGQDALARTFRQYELLSRQSQFEAELQRSQTALQQALDIQRYLSTRVPELGYLAGNAGAPPQAHGGHQGESKQATNPYAYTMGKEPRVADQKGPDRHGHPSAMTSNAGGHHSNSSVDTRLSVHRGSEANPRPSVAETSSFANMHDQRGGVVETSRGSSISEIPIRQARPTMVGTPASQFDPEKDVPALKKAFAGWSVNTKRVVDILSNRNNAQRQIIQEQYDKMFNKKLKDEVGKIGGNVGNALVRLLYLPAVFDAQELQAAMKGLGTDDSALIEVLCTRTPAQISLIKDAYQTAFKKDLATEVASETSGDYRKLLLELLKADREPETAPDVAKAKADAQALFQAGEDRLGTDEDAFIRILSKRSFRQLGLVANEYAKIADYDIEMSIKREMSFNIKKALVTILAVCRNPFEYFAERLEQSMKGIGYNERALTRVIISRCEIDMDNIKQAYYAKYKRNLEAALKSETKGDYRTLLNNLIGTDKGFNPEEDAKTLKRAFKGIGSDNDAIINLLGRRTAEQRVAIAKAYESMYGKTLLKEIESEISNPTHQDFQQMLKSMLFSMSQLDAWTIKKCIEGMGTDNDSLIEVLCTRTNQEIKAIAESYQQMYKSAMAADIEKEWIVSGDYGKVIKELLKADRDESEKINADQARKDAVILYKAGEDRIGTDEKVFIDILTKRNYAHLRVVFDEYAKISDMDFERAISSEMSFNLKKALITIVRVTRNPTEYFADRLYNSMKGLGTNDAQLQRIVLARAETDMAEIRTIFAEKYKATLEKWIQGDTSGPYRRMFFKIIEFSSGASTI